MLRPRPKPKADTLHDVSSSTSRQNLGVADYAYYTSATGGIIRGEVMNIQPKKRRVTPSTLTDKYANWKPFHNKTPNLSILGEEEEDEDISAEPDESGKRKRYASSDDPNTVWLDSAIELLHELYRHDGPGDLVNKPRCTSCLTQPPPEESHTLYRCQDCYLSLECRRCCLKRHQISPLHRLKEWNGSHFTSSSLQSLGLVYQLGHGGHSCPSPDLKLRNMTVLDTNGIHSITIQYCACETNHRTSNIRQLMRACWYPATTIDPRSCATFQVLDLYRLLNVRANVNANNFVSTLVALTNPLGFLKLPDRYVTFARMARQWALLHRIKRSGAGLELARIGDIKPGSLAVICWACPIPGFNLPQGWENVDSKYSYLYMPVLALDANFRLKNKLRKKERPNPPLAPASAYFVDSLAYKDFLKDYVSEKDISTCIAFAALLEKDTKLTTGLKVSGVGGCACARHELIRPQGIGDLQKGERYANMDFILFSAIQNYHLPRIAFSYDIICQWRQTFWERMTRLPPHLHLDPNKTTLTFGLPTWHAVAHELSCRTANALTYQEGVGCTDGEGIERIWSVLNPSGYATKEMGEGTQQDTLDDRIDSHNFGKNITLRTTLARRLEVAITERDRQHENFKTYDKGLDDTTRSLWKEKIQEWVLDRSKPNPYLPKVPDNLPTEDEVRAALSADETKELQDAQAPIYGTSPSAFMIAGLQLEDLQLKIRRDVRALGLGHGTPYQQVKIDQRRRTFLDKLDAFRDLQRIYMPGVKWAIHQQDEQLSLDVDPNAAENIKLWFPSDLPSPTRAVDCVAGVAQIEIQFREARCHDALVTLRHYLHIKQYLLAFRNANVTGQNESTRARGVIDSTGDRVEAEAEKYRCSRSALLALLGIDKHEDYLELTKDVTSLEVVDDPDILSLVQLNDTNSSSKRQTHVSMGKKTNLWIWTALGGPTEQELQGPIGADISVEWSRALARKTRWTEEVESLREEMKRTLRSLDSRVAWWTASIVKTGTVDSRHPQAAIIAGMKAYAAQQADIHLQIGFKCRQEWGLQDEDIWKVTSMVNVS